MNDINELIHEDSYKALSVKLFSALEYNNTKDNSTKLQELFQNYFTPFHKIYDFFDQIEVNLIDSLNDESKFIFHKTINNMLLIYEYKKHSNNTLLDIVKLAIISKAINIESSIFKIWRETEEDKEIDNEFLLSFFQHIVSMPQAQFHYKIIDRVLNLNDDLNPDFMPLILLKKIEQDVSRLPYWLKYFTKKQWEKHCDNYETKMTILSIVRKVDIYDISLVLDKIDKDSFWFIKGLNTLNRITFEKKEEIYYIKDKIRRDKEYKINFNDKLYKLLDVLRIIDGNTKNSNLTEIINNLANDNNLVIDDYVIDDLKKAA
jgi:hypothetical protein